MLKRNTDLFIKLLLLIFLVVLLVLILHAAKNLEQPVEAKTIEVLNNPLKSELVCCSTADCCEIETEDNYLDKIQQWEEEHYYATKTWEYLRQRNFSQAAACGIIGNMMIETSGGTLDLKPNIYSPSGNYYGLCQWSLKYYPGAKDLPFEHQLDYLLGTMPWEFSAFGWLYKEGFTFEDFIILEDPAEAALIFAKVYERCSSVSYNLRQEAAKKAYNYFKLDQLILYNIIYRN